jgi:hypothetical protein
MLSEIKVGAIIARYGLHDGAADHDVDVWPEGD